ncbi:hypothetical protein E3E31_07715 [Thermococcus sp. M39]|uniref:hypothetical protein n=1 Tax=unclassified Thermococcus TaxID=2627626 RepID=UPI00143C3B9B|nr:MULTISPECIES: hypothetical protein [unclassified Thermococcus]NJE08409.1 hypothetical protein [Thermococcus sp. M39]NJE11911.1 hypothetical protein [Thermococcus sp. LS2]
MKKLLFVLILLVLPLASADYYVILDEDLAYLKPYAQNIANFHNGTLIISDFSNLDFLQADDYVLFVVNYSKFNANSVYSLYKTLDFDGDGVYNPIIGFYPVKNEKQFKLWVDALVHSTFNHKALIVEAGAMSYEEYLRLSKNATLIWISGHGDPYGVNLLGWNFDSNHMGNPKGKIFIFESCSVGQIWEAESPLVLNLLNNGSLAVVASIDMGGVSYLPAKFWFSNYSIGKLAQISNAYFVKVGVKPKVVLFGDPALKVENKSYIMKTPAEGFYAYLFPKVNGWLYTPGKPSLLLALKVYGQIFNPMDLWKSIVTESGMMTLLLAVLFVLLLKHQRDITKRRIWISLVSSLASFLLLGFLTYHPPIRISVFILVIWFSVALFMQISRKLAFLVLFFVPSAFISLALLLGFSSFTYWKFAVFAILLSSVLVFLMLLLFSEALNRVINAEP